MKASPAKHAFAAAIARERADVRGAFVGASRTHDIEWGPDELLAMGFLTSAEYIQMVERYGKPFSEVVVKSIDRDRGIVTFEPVKPTVQARIDELDAVIDEAHRKLAATRFVVKGDDES